MHEFNSRIEAQRTILDAVNGHHWSEELCGLSRGAIERWAAANGLREDSSLFRLSFQASRELLCLAAHSHAHIAEEYRVASQRITELVAQIRLEVAKG
jgi:hypothetical protein